MPGHNRHWLWQPPALFQRGKGSGSDGGKPAFENWLVRPSADDLRAYPTRDGGRIDLVRRLREAEAVDLVAYRAGPGCIHVTNRRGTAEITRSAAGLGTDRAEPTPGAAGGHAAEADPMATQAWPCHPPSNTL